MGVHVLIWYPQGSLALDLVGSKPFSAKPEKVKSVVVGDKFSAKVFLTESEKIYPALKDRKDSPSG